MRLTTFSIMTPNGTLIAYTTPASIRELRDQVALVSMSWKEHLEVKATEIRYQVSAESNNDESTERSSRDFPMETLTLEFGDRNLVIRLLQPKLLLVLEGGLPPSRKRPLKITAEGPGDARYPLDEPRTSTTNGEQKNASTTGGKLELPGSPSATSQASTTVSNSAGGRTNILNIHRKKLDQMADMLKKELERAGFVMPEDQSGKFF